MFHVEHRHPTAPAESSRVFHVEHVIPRDPASMFHVEHFGKEAGFLCGHDHPSGTIRPRPCVTWSMSMTRCFRFHE